MRKMKCVKLNKIQMELWLSDYTDRDKKHSYTYPEAFFVINPTSLPSLKR